MSLLLCSVTGPMANCYLGLYRWAPLVYYSTRTTMRLDQKGSNFVNLRRAATVLHRAYGEK